MTIVSEATGVCCMVNVIRREAAGQTLIDRKIRMEGFSNDRDSNSSHNG